MQTTIIWKAKCRDCSFESEDSDFGKLMDTIDDHVHEYFQGNGLPNIGHKVDCVQNWLVQS